MGCILVRVCFAEIRLLSIARREGTKLKPMTAGDDFITS